jgi:hypothetical protein
MNIQPSFSQLRSHLALEFSNLRNRALRERLWARLIGQSTALADFPEDPLPQGLNRKSIGIQDIKVEEIVGTLYRHMDFDAQFRPLRKNLLDRWINIYLLYQREGWPPILAHKVGDDYYIEDGHHRVSVARALGVAYIQAQVWEYPDSSPHIEACPCPDCPEPEPLRHYAPATD